MPASWTCRLHGTYAMTTSGDLCSDLVPNHLPGWEARAYLPPLASNTLLVPPPPTRFPAALGIGHGMPAA